MDPTSAFEDLDVHVAAVFDTRVSATRCIRLVCEYCDRFSLLPVTSPGADEERPWVCPLCGPDFERDFREWRRGRRRP